MSVLYPVFGSAFCHSTCVHPGADVVIAFPDRVARATYYCDDPARILARRFHLWYTILMPHRFVAVPVEHAGGASGGFYCLYVEGRPIVDGLQRYYIWRRVKAMQGTGRSLGGTAQRRTLHKAGGSEGGTPTGFV